jgi:hypothetical protein
VRRAATSLATVAVLALLVVGTDPAYEHAHAAAEHHFVLEVTRG